MTGSIYSVAVQRTMESMERTHPGYHRRFKKTKMAS